MVSFDVFVGYYFEKFPKLNNYPCGFLELTHDAILAKLIAYSLSSSISSLLAPSTSEVCC
jgi:hypothetical protein